MVYRQPPFIAAIFIILLSALACSNSPDSPVIPEKLSFPLNSAVSDQTHTQLWGLYEISIDIPNKTVDSVPLRTAMFTANVVKFINQKPTNLKFKINDTPIGSDYVDVDIDVTISHPFPGFHQYDGYDVRGVFMGDGSATLSYNPDLAYPVNGSDQFMLPDPDDGLGGVGGPDGYTRWYNMTEFSTGTMPLFSYTPGTFASKGFNGSATLCPYKYFADGLSADESPGQWLENNIDNHGIFSAGNSNTRNYYLRFPNSVGVKYGYAIIASWGGVEPEFHPWNAPEAIACDTNYTGNVFYIDPDTNGGKFAMDIDLYNWHGQPSSIFIESTVLSAPYEFSPTDLTPIGGNDIFSTYQVDITADNVTAVDGNEYWVIAEYGDYDYSNPYGIPNDAENEPLAAFFRFDLEVNGNPTNLDPVCDLIIDSASPAMPFEGWGAFIFDASGSYDPDGTDLTFEWDFDNDDVFGDYYNFGTPDKPVKVFEFTNQDKVSVHIIDENGGETICSVDVDIIGHPSKNIPLREGVEPYDLAVDHGDGDLLVYYEDREVWKHLIANYYDSPTLILTTNPAYVGQNRIDIAANGWFLCAGYISAYQRPMGQFYDPDGLNPQYWNFEWGPDGFVSDEYRFIDVIAWGANGEHMNDIGPLTGAPFEGNHEIRYLSLNDTNNYHAWTRYKHIHSGTDHTGLDKIYYDYVAAAESDQDGEHVWYLENVDYYTTRWIVTPVVTNATYTQTYDGEYFGSGAQTDDDDGWNDGKDLTRDDENRFYVLDELSTGDPRVKVWSSDTTALGGFGDSVTISSTPIRIEGSDFNGNVVVLHGNSTDGWFISVFIPGEMPD